MLRHHHHYHGLSSDTATSIYYVTYHILPDRVTKAPFSISHHSFGSLLHVGDIRGNGSAQADNALRETSQYPSSDKDWEAIGHCPQGIREDHAHLSIDDKTTTVTATHEMFVSLPYWAVARASCHKCQRLLQLMVMQNIEAKSRETPEDLYNRSEHYKHVSVLHSTTTCGSCCIVDSNRKEQQNKIHEGFETMFMKFVPTKITYYTITILITTQSLLLQTSK